MVVDLKQQLERVAAKADLLVGKCRILTQQRDEALSRLAQMEQQLTECQKELEQLRVDNEHLRTVTTLYPDRKAVEEARSLISGLVRDIDRCILDLND